MILTPCPYDPINGDPSSLGMIQQPLHIRITEATGYLSMGAAHSRPPDGQRPSEAHNNKL